MEFIIIGIVSLILLGILKLVFGYKQKELENIGKDDELDELAKKYPSNIDICKAYLKKLNNENVKIEQNNNAENSLYIVTTNKIMIADIQKSYTRIQTIAHECLHSIQDKKLLWFNFIFSNIYVLYFLVVSVLALFRILPYKMIFLSILMMFGIVYLVVRIYLENDAMIKARFLAKEYMEEQKISTKKEIEKLVNGFDKINNFGIKCVNYYLFMDVITRIFIFSLICLVR